MVVSTVDCLSCGAGNPADSKFCSDCGTPVSVERSCPACDAMSPAAARFCVGCGFNFLELDKPSNQSTLTNRLFLERLDLNTADGLADLHADVPFGFKAIIQSNNRVWEIRPEGTSFQDKKGLFASLIARVKQAVKVLAGAKQAPPLIYLVPDLELLPIARATKSFEVVGEGEVSVAYSFWLGDDDIDLSIFSERYASLLTGKSIGEFANFAKQELEGLYDALVDAGVPGSSTWNAAIVETFRRSTGISMSVTRSDKSKTQNRYLELNDAALPTVCSKCSEPMNKAAKFCEICGEAANSSASNFTKRMVDASGDKLAFSLKISIQASDQTPAQLSDFEMSLLTKCAETLTPVIAHMSLDEMATPGAISRLDETLNSEVPKGFDFTVSNIKILDIRSSKSDWLFNTNQLIDEQVREFDALKAQLAVDAAEGEYEAAMFEVALAKRDRQIRQVDDLRNRDLLEAQQKLDTSKSMDGIDAAHEELQLDQQIRSINNDAAILRAWRATVAEQAEAERKEDSAQKQHETDLATQEVKAQVEQDDLRSDAEIARARKQDLADLEKAEGKSKLEQAELDNESRRSNEKLQLMAEIEAEMSRQDQQFELEKVASMKGLSAAEILSMQAAQLAKLSNAENVADLVGKISGGNSSDMSKAEMQQLYERMIEEKDKSLAAVSDAQQKSTETVLEANKSLSETILKNSDQRLEGFKEASSSARSTNEKAMESMAKVATGVAQRKEGKEVLLVPCKNLDCTYNFENKAKAFCPLCGDQQ